MIPATRFQKNTIGMLNPPYFKKKKNYLGGGFTIGQPTLVLFVNQLINHIMEHIRNRQLHQQISPGGDVADASGFSPYPGNINILLFSLPRYAERLDETSGVVPEFVNPKWAWLCEDEAEVLHPFGHLGNVNEK